MQKYTRLIFFVFLAIFACAEESQGNAIEKKDDNKNYQIAENWDEELSYEVVLDQGYFVEVASGTFDFNLEDIFISSFYIGKSEVTQKLWTEVMSESFEEYAINGLDQSMAYDDVYRSKPDIDFKAIAFKEDYPAFIIDYLDALEFCNRLSLIHGLAPLYSISDGLIKVDYTKEGYRLPTSSEWFFAAIGGNYSKGYTFFGSDILNEVGVVFGDDPVNGPFYEGMISKIESKLPNELGLFDMNGNVEEWVWDYGGYLIEGMYITELATNQGSDNSKRQRLFKLGGSWMDTGFVLENIIEQQSFPRFLLADSRVAFLNDGKRYLEAGFRIVKNIPFDVEEINSRNGSL